MSNSKTILSILLVTASVIASLLIHHRANTAILNHATLLQQQSQQLADSLAEQQRLSNLIAHAGNPRVEDHAGGLAKLRSQAESLRKQTNELVKQSKLHLTSQPSRPASTPRTYTPEYLEQMRQAQGTKGTEARDIAYAMSEYAQDHHNQYPSSLDQITPYLVKENRTLSGTNQFEIVFQGSSDELDGIPWSSIAVIRETQPWLTPDGRPARVYGMIGGFGQTVTSDDNFQSWEAEHVISPPNPAR